MSKGGRYLRQPQSGGRNSGQTQPKKSKKALKIVLIILAVLVLLIVLLLAGLYIYYRSLLNLVNQVPETNPSMAVTADTQPAGTDPSGETQGGQDATEESTEPEQTWPQVVPTQNVTTIMLVGQDGRYGEESKLSDTMIMCTINRETKTLTMTSILRDCYVPLPAYAGHGPGQNRINVCYNLGYQWTGSSKGGMEMLALCVEQNFGIPIDHTIEVDFEAFEKIVDLLGGVEIELTEAEAKYMTEMVGYVGDFEPGLQTLDGLAALAYARIRKIDATGDFARTNRQRTVINSLLSKCRQMSIWDLNSLAREILPLITTDMTTDQMNNYIWEFLPMLTDLTIVSQKIPLEKDALGGAWSYKGVDKEGIGGVMELNLWSHKKALQEQLGYADAE